MAPARFSLRPDASRAAPLNYRVRYAGLAGAIGFHIVLIVGLLQYTPVRHSLARVTPIVVSVITPLPEPPPPLPPKQFVTRKPMPKQIAMPVQKAVEPPPVVSEAPSVSPITMPPPAPPPTPTPEAEVGVAPPPSPPIVPPRFNADYLHNPPPPYPALARRLREQGRVLVRVLVSSDGAPERVELKTSSGSPRLDQSALDTIRNWKFVPARQGDQSVAAWVLVPVNFTLDS